MQSWVVAPNWGSSWEQRRTPTCNPPQYNHKFHPCEQHKQPQKSCNMSFASVKISRKFYENVTKRLKELIFCAKIVTANFVKCWNFSSNGNSTKTELRPKSKFDQNWNSNRTKIRPKPNFDRNLIEIKIRTKLKETERFGRNSAKNQNSTKSFGAKIHIFA